VNASPPLPILKDGESPSREELVEWLQGLGIRSQTNRVLQLLSALEGDPMGKVSWKGQTVPLASVTFGELATALIELRDLIEIYYAFRSDNTAIFKDKLGAALSGPLTIVEESTEKPANTAGRNIMFELSLAAHWRLLGLDVELSDPDVILHVGDITFYVECKRPFSEHSVRSNLRDALRQLNRKLSHAASTSHFGLVALSVTRILNKDAQYAAVRQYNSNSTLFYDQLVNFWQEHKRHVPKDCEPNITAVVLHLAVPTVVGDQAVRNISSHYFAPIGGIGPAFTLLRDVLEPLFIMRQEALWSAT
jgi:hypothetical protein